MVVCIIHVHGYLPGKKHWIVSHYLIMIMIDKSGRKGDNRLYYLSYYLSSMVEKYICSHILHVINIYWYLEVLINTVLRLKENFSINILQVGRLRSKDVSQLFLNNWLSSPTTKLTFQKKFSTYRFRVFCLILMSSNLQFMPSADFFVKLLCAKPDNNPMIKRRVRLDL